MPDPGQAAPMSAAAPELTDSPYAAFRLGITLALMTIGNCGMYAVAVMLPAVQAEFGVARADASLPYTLMMVGFGVGGVLMGKLADRFGVMLPLLIGAASLGLSGRGHVKRHRHAGTGARLPDRPVQQFSYFRTAGGGYFAVVCAPAPTGALTLPRIGRSA